MPALLLHDLWDVTDQLRAGGPVMIPLVVVSIVMWMLIVNRAVFLRAMYRKNMSRSLAGEHVRHNIFPDTRAYRGATALLVREFLKRRSGDPEVDRFILDETVLSVIASFDRHLATIGVLAAVAPLLGLLGTVTGMIATFDVLCAFGTGNAAGLASGISEALITTQTGLLVAIPGLYIWHFLSRRVLNLKHRVASVGIYLKRSLEPGEIPCST
ncbi:MotA/TolQ/ExbB proton channel family protein [Thermodesulfobacteriota bacterium]